ncbi:MAG: 1-acyl-sn-glycerol-3-phosphate acyltransferase [Flavobacteriales bacterium]|nr:1-acyl-sn-glycerol-3-phosphate acyltransferase [Flavobacteriales bacterium]
MKYLLAPIFVLYKLWIGLVFWTTLLLLYPLFFVLLSKTTWYPIAFRLKRFWALILSALLFCPIKKKILAPLPEGAFIICSNHTSYLDTVFMYRAIDRYFLFVGKGELLKWPLFRTFFKTMDIPVYRQHNRKAFSALQKAYEAIRRGECVAIYPEGTIPAHTPRMKAFKNGAFRMAADLKVPIVPVTWTANHLIMKDPARIFEPSLPHISGVVIHAPCYPKGDSDADLIALRTEVFERIQSALPPQYHRHVHED